MEIREAKIADIPALCLLLNSLFTQETEFKPNRAIQAQGLADIITNPESGDIIVARKSGEIVGMVNLLYTISN